MQLGLCYIYNSLQLLLLSFVCLALVKIQWFFSFWMLLMLNHYSPFVLHHQSFFSSNAAAQASRKSSPRVTNEAVQKAVSAYFLFCLFCICSAKFVLYLELIFYIVGLLRLLL